MDDPRRLPRTLIAIPTYNERENLPPLLRALRRAQPAADLLVVDDGSPDGTGEIADSMARADAHILVSHRKGKLGLGTAYLEAFRLALGSGYDLVVQMDADFSHRVEDVQALVEAAAGADVAIGSRFASGGRSLGRSALRRFISAGASSYARGLLGLPVLDCTSGFKAISRRGLVTILEHSITSTGFGFQVEVNHVCSSSGLRLVEVPIVFADRVAGRSKMSLRIFVEAAMLVLRLRAEARREAARAAVAAR